MEPGTEDIVRIWIGLLAFIAIGCGAAWSQTPGGAEARLKEKNIELPAPPTPVANYVGAVRTGNLLFLSGHGPSPAWRGKGKVGKDVTPEDGYKAARDVGLNLLATTRQNLGSLDKVKRVVKVLGMVNSAPGFTDQPKVINGFSDLMVEVFGEAIGKHARSAVGMAELPFGIPVEIEMVLEVE
jgi:enamine deaminase RidA (YjgF/YER057c/UK114 family)